MKILISSMFIAQVHDSDTLFEITYEPIVVLRGGQLQKIYYLYIARYDI